MPGQDRPRTLRTGPFSRYYQHGSNPGEPIIGCGAGTGISAEMAEAGGADLDEAVEKVMAMARAARQVNPDIIVLCHGGPLDEPQNAGQALARMHGIAGFFGASSIERLPTERAIADQVKSFKGLKLAKP
ncbi:MAG: phosphoenolpyruvate hydrolase family protein [Clostridia bacterium]|nr:phosphoenolpyruvate hydrolase family protein [Clostridia bacterium]